MRICKIRDLEIGSGIPKICIPIIGKNKKEILDLANKINNTDADLVEWRLDWFDDIEDIMSTVDVLKKLRNILNEKPILVTFRTANEGGKRNIKVENYVELNCYLIKTKLVDLIDIEVFIGDEYVKKIVTIANEHNVKVIGSNHDFEKTPFKEEIISRLVKMQNLGVDISKIAVMPNSKKDVLTLLSATEEMYSKYADRPIVTVSMSGSGIISRLSGEFFGSSITFGAVEKISAPGQLNIEDLKKMLNILHNNL